MKFPRTPRSLIAGLGRRLGKLRRAPLGRFNVRTRKQAGTVLAHLADAACNTPEQRVLVVGSGDADQRALCVALDRIRRPWRAVAAQEVRGLDAAALDSVGCIALATTDSRAQLDVASQLVRNAAAAEIPLEYIALPHLENAAIGAWDRYRNEDFVSPQLAVHGPRFLEIYRESLTRFAQKTDVRDFLDLCQLLESIVARDVPGVIAEFGSFRGHSGYLCSRTLEALGSDKTLYMFDTFEAFPQENAGVDRFWSGTHKVSFEEVQGKLADRANVRLVRGDFTQTLSTTDTGPIALAYVDCDSYRATRFLLETLWTQRLASGGIIAMEDYGHAALLGNRAAVHEFFEGRRDAYTWFSQFSGFFVAVKLAR